MCGHSTQKWRHCRPVMVDCGTVTGTKQLWDHMAAGKTRHEIVSGVMAQWQQKQVSTGVSIYVLSHASTQGTVGMSEKRTGDGKTD